jgi:hypothetical protein
MFFTTAELFGGKVMTSSFGVDHTAQALGNARKSRPGRGSAPQPKVISTGRSMLERAPGAPVRRFTTL